MHSAGFVYNDLKLDNLLLENVKTNVNNLYKSDDDIFDKYNVNLIDFGYISSYMDESTHKHID